MPFNAILTPDDLKKGELVEPGWYNVEIVKYREEDAKSDKSCNTIFDFKILDGAFAGFSLMTRYNEKALGFGKALWKTLGFPFDEKVGYKLSTQLFEQTVGSKLQVYVKRGTSDAGKAFNDVQDYRPLAA